jgi:hypothetical protein
VTLPPGTPRAIIDGYREAFRNVVADGEFTKTMDQVMQGYTVITPEEMVAAINDLVTTRMTPQNHRRNAPQLEMMLRSVVEELDALVPSAIPLH